VFWNEEWGPVVQNDTWPHPASALHRVPDAIDWVSLVGAWVASRAVFY